MVAAPAKARSNLTVKRLSALRRVVRDLAASVAFYRHGLGFRVVGDVGAPALRGVVVMALGAERIELVAAAHAGVRWPVPAEAPGVRFQHVAVVASDMGRAYHQLQSVAPVPISRGGPQQLPEASGGMRAFKFRDPDGHPLALVEFPAHGGHRRWHTPQARRENDATLGIDHAAICVAHADHSIAFYEQLGFGVSTRRRITGAEQARLDGLDLSELEVIALHPSDSSGPHLEVLAYQTPSLAGTARARKSQPSAQVTQDRLVWQLADAQVPGLLADPDGHLNEFIGAATKPDQSGTNHE